MTASEKVRMLRCASSFPLLSQGQACCGVRKSAPHSSGFARLACGTFSEAVMFTRDAMVSQNKKE